MKVSADTSYLPAVPPAPPLQQCESNIQHDVWESAVSCLIDNNSIVEVSTFEHRYGMKRINSEVE